MLGAFFLPSLARAQGAVSELPDGFYLVAEPGEFPEGETVIVFNEREHNQEIIRRQPVLTVPGIRSVRAEERRSGEVSVLVRLDGVQANEVHLATTTYLRRRLALVVGGVALSAPFIAEPIRSTTIQISGGDTPAEAEAFAARLRALAHLQH